MTDSTATELSNLIDCIDLIYTETVTLGRSITDEQAKLATGCPGWSVHDQLAHMVGFEQSLVGSPEPDVDVGDLDHIQNDFGRYMEQHVQARRALPFAAVVDEMAGLHLRRIDQLRRDTAAGDVEVTMPWGSKRPMSESLKVRVLDLWSHEQDIRIAIGVPPRTDGPDGDLAESRTLGAWKALLPKGIEGPGQIRITFTDGDQSSTVVKLGDESESSDGPTVSIAGTRSALTCLGFGRQPTSDYLSQVTVDGDPDLLDRVVAKLAFTP